METRELHIGEGSPVATASRERVGKVDRIVMNPITMGVSHVVVRKGFFFPEDKVIPVGMVATADDEMIVLTSNVDTDELEPFEEEHCIEADSRADSEDQTAGMIPPMLFYGAYGLPTPLLPSMLHTVTIRNIPDRAIALTGDVPVVTKDGEEVGRFDEIIVTKTGVATHMVITTGGPRRAVPMWWIDSVSDDQITLGVLKQMVNAVPAYDPTTFSTTITMSATTNGSRISDFSGE